MIALLLVGCGPDAAPSARTPATLETEGEVARYEAVGSQGIAPAIGWVRALDEHGMAVPRDPLTITIDGVARSITFDANGYAEVVRTTPGTTRIEEAGEPVSVHAFAGPFDTFGLNPATQPWASDAPSLVADVDGAELVADGSTVWWVPRAGTGTHRVVAGADEILGLRAVAIDVDGITDAVAWTAHEVFLLRGRLKGGMARGGVLDATGYTVAGADVADINEDNLPDLVLAWASDTTSWIDVWHGDGAWQFDPIEPRRLPALPTDLAIGDNTGEVQPQVTVALEDGSWSRWIEGAPGAMIPIGPSTPGELVLPAASRLIMGADMNGDEADEMYAFGPRVPGLEREMSMYELDRDVLRLQLPGHFGAAADWADANEDNRSDLWILDEDGTLDVVWYDLPETGEANYQPLTVDNLPLHGPIATGMWFQGDTVPDLFVAGNPLWAWWQGRSAVTDPSVFWKVSDPGDVGVSSGEPYGLHLLELDGDPTSVEVVHFTADDDGTRLRLTSIRPGAGAVLGSVVVAPDGSPVDDFDVCDGVVWVLAGGRVYTVKVSTGVPKSLEDQSTAATRVACGDLGGGVVAVLLSNDEFVPIDEDLHVVGSRIPAEGAHDLALVDLGTGRSIQSCKAADCAMLRWNWAPGQEATVTTSSDTIQVVSALGTQSWPGGGVPSTADIDADGLDDLLVAGPIALGWSQVALVRSTGSAITEPRWWTLRSEVRGPAAAIDGNGDGKADLWWVDPTGAIRVTNPPYVPLLDTEDTGFVLDTDEPTPTTTTTTTETGTESGTL